MPDVVVDLEDDGMVAAKFSDAAWEINVRADRADFLRLSGIRDADWDARRSLKVGNSAGSHVFWARKADTVELLVGRDDETWDIGISMPLEMVDRLVSCVHDL